MAGSNTLCWIATWVVMCFLFHPCGSVAQRLGEMLLDAETARNDWNLDEAPDGEMDNRDLLPNEMVLSEVVDEWTHMVCNAMGMCLSLWQIVYTCIAYDSGAFCEPPTVSSSTVQVCEGTPSCSSRPIPRPMLSHT